MPEARSPKGREEAAFRHHYATLLNRPDVTGVGMGLRKRNGRLTDEKVLKVFVAHKRKGSDLPSGAVLPLTLAAPSGYACLDARPWAGQVLRIMRSPSAPSRSAFVTGKAARTAS
jgi:hypothetical protein